MRKFLLICVATAVLAVVLRAYDVVNGPLLAWLAGAGAAAAIWQRIAPRIGATSVLGSLVAALLLIGLAMLIASQNWWDFGHDLAAAFAMAASICFAVVAATAVGNRTAAPA